MPINADLTFHLFKSYFSPVNLSAQPGLASSHPRVYLTNAFRFLASTTCVHVIDWFGNFVHTYTPELASTVLEPFNTPRSNLSKWLETVSQMCRVRTLTREPFHQPLCRHD